MASRTSRKQFPRLGGLVDIRELVRAVLDALRRNGVIRGHEPARRGVQLRLFPVPQRTCTGKQLLLFPAEAEPRGISPEPEARALRMLTCCADWLDPSGYADGVGGKP